MNELVLDGSQQVWWGDYRNIDFDVRAALLITDPPPIPEGTRIRDYVVDAVEMFESFDRFVDRNTVMLIIPRDAKGMYFAKSTVLAVEAASHGWQLYKQYCWLRAEADYHRSHSAWSPIYAFRRSGSNVSGDRRAPLFYTDVIRVMDTVWAEGGSEIAPFPPLLLRAFFDLFRVDGLVFDPFAGSGHVAIEAVRRGLPSLSAEINQQRAFDIIAKIGEAEVAKSTKS